MKLVRGLHTKVESYQLAPGLIGDGHQGGSDVSLTGQSSREAFVSEGYQFGVVIRPGAKLCVLEFLLGEEAGVGQAFGSGGSLKVGGVDTFGPVASIIIPLACSSAIILSARKAIARNHNEVSMGLFIESVKEVVNAKVEYAGTRPRRVRESANAVMDKVLGGL